MSKVCKTSTNGQAFLRVLRVDFLGVLCGLKVCFPQIQKNLKTQKGREDS